MRNVDKKQPLVKISSVNGRTLSEVKSRDQASKGILKKPTVFLDVFKNDAEMACARHRRGFSN